MKVFIFSERGYDYNAGRGNNQGLGNNPDPTCDATGSRLHTKNVNTGAEAIYLHYWADNYYNNTGQSGTHKWPKDKGVVWVQLWGGVIECTNTYDGIKRTVVADNTVQQIEVKRKDESNHLTWFEFDWYPPEELDEEEFRLYVTTNHHQWNNPGFKTKTYDFGVFSGANTEIAPTISEPFLYMANENGTAGYGKLATVYMSASEISEYYTSQDATHKIKTEASGMLAVEPHDTVQHGFRACFYELRSSDNTTWRWVWSNKVDVPAYHKIHDFRQKTYQYYVASLDRWYADYRYKQLTWQIRYPQEEDAVDGDIFELQRAYNADFSDAQTIDIIPMDYDPETTVNDIQSYSYIDSTEAAWWNPVERSYKIYYRLRRASSSVWGWEGNPCVATITADVPQSKEYIIQDFASTMHSLFSYTKAPDYETTRGVVLSWRFRNGISGSFTQGDPGFVTRYWDSKQRLILRKILEEHNDTILIEIPQDSIIKAIRAAIYSTESAYYTGYYNIRFYYTDHVNTPCTHYKYETYIDTTGIIVKDLKWYESYILPVYPMDGPSLYYTEAANINTFKGSDKEYSDCVLLTWDLTDGDIGTYSIEASPNSSTPWTLLAEGLTQNWYKDTQADPTVTDKWNYQLRMRYECNGTVLSDVAMTTGSRSPYGKISGRITYADGTGCPGIEVNASRVSDGEVIQRVQTDDNGYYLIDRVLYCGDTQYAITPVSQSAEFRYNNTSSAFATITLSLDHSVVTDIDFENTSSVRVSGRILYENSTIPVRDANFLVNGKLVTMNGNAYKTDASGSFEFNVPKSQGFTLQAVKDGHWFAGDGYVRIEGDSLLTLTKPLDGVRIYDRTKVRLIGRLAGGNIQASKPLGFGLSTNYLGDDLKMVFELEGDNISQIVHMQDDPDRDTILQQIDSTRTLFSKKRITIQPDVATGEYAVDLFPVRYKITQATANGYATLFADGKTTETLDLSDVAGDRLFSVNDRDTVHYNASYCITYHSPINITCTQLKYGMEIGYYGEETMSRKNILNQNVTVPLAIKQPDGSYEYLFGAPVYATDNYSFRVSAHEDYYYNNDESSNKHEEVRIHGGKLKVYNGLHDDRTTEIKTYELNPDGQVDIKVPVDYVSFIKQGEDALRVLDLSVEYEGLYVEKQAVRAYVTGNVAKGHDFVTSTHGDIILLDILRDPPGSQSYAFVEEGTTYKYNYSYKFDFDFGLDVLLGYGANGKYTMGAYAGSPAAGSYAGYVTEYNTETKFDLPITSSYLYHKTGSYTFTTSSRIETDNEKYFVDQTGNGKYFVGQEADVYIGAIQNIYYGITNAVKPIDSVTYASLHSRDIYGAMRVVNSGRDKNGKLWYLVIGEETEVGTYLNSTFVYTHDYIENTLLPQLRKQRNELIYTGDSATVQAIADAKHQPVYWSKVVPNDSTFAADGYYQMMIPTGDTTLYDNEVASYNRQIEHWIDIFIKNETEKVNAIYSNNSQKVGTWSVSGGTLVSHSETYEYGAMHTKRIDYPGASVKFGTGLVGMLTNAFGSSIANNLAKKWLNETTTKQPDEIILNAPTGHMIFELTPIFNLDLDYMPESGSTHMKKTGFVLEPDNFGHESVSVYRVVDTKDKFNSGSDDIRDFISDNNYGLNLTEITPDSLYGSYVYFLEGGASRCPYEQAYTTSCYTPALPLSAGSFNLENQRLDINVHERSNVPADQPAVFQLKLTNESDGDFGGAAAPISFYLKQKEGSNAHGARLIVDGMPLTGDGRAIKISHDEVITKTLQVYAGEGYDYENITLELASPCDPYNKVACVFSVHYLPVSCPVNITAPHDKWVMNTLSTQDSVGYYLPVVIDGFDVNYNGFDHIEFQYKLSTQSDEAWVNLCSYYANDSLYNAASGNKAMIDGGRIENVHFYGERDPMEQQYDLRAVSFCRYGNGFIHRASPVLSGIKDTRPPRVFGQPEPANAILGVGDNLVLRFNEPIAGNYLDEDNNFQLTGITNETGITTGASLVFDGQGAYAETKVNRTLSESFSIDMLVKPVETNNDEVFFLHGDDQDLLLFGKTYDNRLSLTVGNDAEFFSQSLEAPITAFTRVIVTYDAETGAVRFYAGTKEVTDASAPAYRFDHTAVAPLNFGYGLKGNLLEARVWTKALTPAEIANTHMKYLSGYERELLAYYPMNEGEVETVTDKAHGATLFTHGTAWQFEKGISLYIPATDSVELAGDLMARSSVQDETLMFWFKTSSDGSLFSAASGFRLAIENGTFVLYNGEERHMTNHECTDGGWHHAVLTINRTHNSVALFLDEQMVITTAAVNFCSISGRMTLGGNGFEGNIDEIAVFEQALPKSFVESYAHISPYGDEMGLMAYLPFEENKENENGVIEQVFSVNDQRQFKTSDGTVIHKVVPLVTGGLAAAQADKTNFAPVRKQGQLTKLNFDWSFNGDELMINLNMQDREINKQTIYVTVRDVEDLNGNPMQSPVTWTAFVDRNHLKWEDDDLDIYSIYGEDPTDYDYYDVRIINNSGRRHTYTIESLPDWLSVDKPSGNIDPLQDKTLRFYYNAEMPVGEYVDIVYLTSEDGLSEPLEVEYTVKAYPPYNNVDKGKYPLNMSLCGQVVINDEIDTDPQDIVYAMYRNECIGMANIEFDEVSNKSELYLTIYGSDELKGKKISFALWRASTGKTIQLSASTNIKFASGSVRGCKSDEIITLTNVGSTIQNIKLGKGWNWISYNLNLQPSNSQLNNVLIATKPWSEDDLIKNPATQHFSTYSEETDAFAGSLAYLRYKYTYMFYSNQENTMLVSGNNLPEDLKYVDVSGGGKWTALPCLFSEVTPLTEAMADYFDNATEGDLIKSHDQFATFSYNGKWVGDLKNLKPGEGYFLRRQAAGSVRINFYELNIAGAPRHASAAHASNHGTQASSDVDTQESAFTNPAAASNMTMIATIRTAASANQLSQGSRHQTATGSQSPLRVYVNDELAAVAQPTDVDGDTLYFLTIQCDNAGELRFETEDGTALCAITGAIDNIPDSHYGSLKAPVILVPEEDKNSVYKIIEDDHIVIIRNGERYDPTGKKLTPNR